MASRLVVHAEIENVNDFMEAIRLAVVAASAKGAAEIELYEAAIAGLAQGIQTEKEKETKP